MSCLKGFTFCSSPGFSIPWFRLDLGSLFSIPGGRLPIPLRVRRYLRSPYRAQIAFSRSPPLVLLTRCGFPARPCRCTFGRELNCSLACCRQHLSVRITLTLKVLLAL